MSEIHEMKTLDLQGEVFNSFPDQQARGDILKKLPLPAGAAQVGQYLRVLSVDAEGKITALEATDAPAGEGGNAAGLTADQIAAIDGMFKVCAYDDSKDISGAYKAFKNAFGLNVPATGIMLSKTALSFTDTASQLITATVEPSNSTDTVVWTTSAPGVATVVNGVVTPVANGSCTITATAGSVSASCSVSVAFEVEVVYYTVTNSLTNCVSNNNTARIVEGGSYTATLTADESYTLEGASVSVLVNDEDVTDTAYADGVITIPNVMGNVVISATAVEENADSGEIVSLAWIGTDGESYIDTDFAPRSVNHKYLLGFQLEEEITPRAYFFGIRNNQYTKDMWDLMMASYSNTGDTAVDNQYVITYEIGDKASTLATGQEKYDSEKSGLKFNERPMYVYLTNGIQGLYTDEAMTTQPTGGTFSKLSRTETTTETDDRRPVSPCYIGKVNNLYDDTVLAQPAKFFCFRVWDENDNLIVDMKPAKKGSAVGMYDYVRQKFFGNAGAGSITYEEVSA